MSRIIGVDRLFKSLNGLDNSLRNKELSKTLFASSRIVQEAVKANAPEKTGELKKNIRRRRIKTDGLVTGVEVYLAPKIFYGHILELGSQQHFLALPGQKIKINGSVVSGPITHPGLSPRPFFRPAIDASKDLFLADFSKRVKTEIKKNAKR